MRFMRGISAISLFSGCGGTDSALQRSGFRVVWANDIWDVAYLTYRDNIPNPKIELGDIADFGCFPAAQLLVGCYPCQGYSQGGRRTSDAPVNFLYRQFDRVLRAVRPRAFVVENVSGMAFGENLNLLSNQLRRYRLAGYRVTWKVLDAKDYGVPQTRRRIFIVGIRSDLGEVYTFPGPTHGPGRHHPYVTQREVIGHLPSWPSGGFCPEPLHWYYLSRNRRATWGKPSPCIVGHWRQVPLHPFSPPLVRRGSDDWCFGRAGRARRLSYNECALLQGFPPEWQWNRGTVRQRFQLIGNAVPPPLFEAVIRAVPPVWN
jgi:DNA (cytosine-5)-methyltransferase 1